MRRVGAVRVDAGLDRRVAARAAWRPRFALPPEEDLRARIAKLAEVRHREMGVPVRSANRER